MFCSKCGSEIERGDMFCGMCGQKVTGNASATKTPGRPVSPDVSYTPIRPVWGNPHNKYKVIKRANAKKSMLTIGWIGVILCIIIFAVDFAFFIYPEAFFEIAGIKNYRYSVLSEIKPYFGISAFLLFFVAITQMFKLIATAKSFICVCEEGVYGVAGAAFFFTTQPFEVGYDQITNVGKGSPILGNIRIDCGPNTYGCIISNPEEIIDLIREKIRRQ